MTRRNDQRRSSGREERQEDSDERQDEGDTQVDANAEAEASSSELSGRPNDGGGPSTASMDDAQARALIRRQQVRRAQIQHRQRRANYVRELEQGVVQTRQDIEDTAEEVVELQVENAHLRTRLGMTPSIPQYIGQPGQTYGMAPNAAMQYSLPAAYSDASGSQTYAHQPYQQPSVTMHWGYDQTMQVPAFQITSAPTASAYPTTALDWEPPHASGLGQGQDHDQYPPLPDLTPEQMHGAVNFILASVDHQDQLQHEEGYEYEEDEAAERHY